MFREGAQRAGRQMPQRQRKTRMLWNHDHHGIKRSSLYLQRLCGKRKEVLLHRSRCRKEMEASILLSNLHRQPLFRKRMKASSLHRRQLIKRKMETSNLCRLHLNKEMMESPNLQLQLQCTASTKRSPYKSLLDPTKEFSMASLQLFQALFSQKALPLFQQT